MTGGSDMEKRVWRAGDGSARTTSHARLVAASLPARIKDVRVYEIEVRDGAGEVHRELVRTYEGVRWAQGFAKRLTASLGAPEPLRVVGSFLILG